MFEEITINASYNIEFTPPFENKIKLYLICERDSIESRMWLLYRASECNETGAELDSINMWANFSHCWK